MKMRVIRPTPTNDVLLNPDSGYLLIQRGHNKVKYTDLTGNEWFLKDGLADKITIDVPWCLVEPREGEFCWEHKEFEGCFDSWIKAGFKVALEIRSMSTLGTLQNDGVPQWVFDAGAKYIDEKSEHGSEILRYPVYWDDIYLEKVGNLVEAFGKRYNQNDAVEFVMPGHVGRWGEMHISEHTPIRPWIEAGFNFDNYFKAMKSQTEMYKRAFPDRPIFQELSNPSYNSFDEALGKGPMSIIEAREIVPYLVENNINLKCNSIGANWDGRGTDFYSEGWFNAYAESFYHKVKICIENIATFHAPNELPTIAACHASYTNHGGERQGLAECQIDTINNDYFRPFERHDPLSKWYYVKNTEKHPEVRHESLKQSARIAGYRFFPFQIQFPQTVESGKEFYIDTWWKNLGAVMAYEDFTIVYALSDQNGNIVFEQAVKPIIPTSSLGWDGGRTVEERAFLRVTGVKPGEYLLMLGMRGKHGAIKLPLFSPDVNFNYPIAPVEVQ